VTFITHKEHIFRHYNTHWTASRTHESYETFNTARTLIHTLFIYVF